MKVYLSFLCCLFFSNLTTAQQLDNRLVTFGEAAMDAPADQATLTVSLSYGDDKDASLVYELHQLNQQKLAAVLKELKVADKDITYSQLVTRKERDFAVGGGTQERIKSFQQAIITLSDLKLFAAVQRRLVSDGFTDVSSTFKVGNQKELENQLLLKAIGRAREKADLMAKAISRTVKRVIRLGDAEEAEQFNARSMLLGVQSLNPTRYAQPLSQTTQLVHLTSQVKLIVELE